MLFSTESLAGAATAAQRANKLGDQPFALIHLPAPPPATICQGLFSVNFLEYSHFGKTNRRGIPLYRTQVWSLHYAIRAMGATSLRISELCLPFSPHPKNFRWQFQTCPSFLHMLGASWANEEEGESESKVTNQIFGRLQHPKIEVRYLENIFFRL